MAIIIASPFGHLKKFPPAKCSFRRKEQGAPGPHPRCVADLRGGGPRRPGTRPPSAPWPRGAGSPREAVQSPTTSASCFGAASHTVARWVTPAVAVLVPGYGCFFFLIKKKKISWLHIIKKNNIVFRVSYLSTPKYPVSSGWAARTNRNLFLPLADFISQT